MANGVEKRKPKAQLSKQEGQALAERWRQSGESKTEFCRRAGVAVHVLRYWLEREAEGRPSSQLVRSKRVAPRDFFVVSATERSSDDNRRRKGQMAGQPVRGESGRKAVLVVIPEANATLLAQTVRALLGETSP